MRSNRVKNWVILVPEGSEVDYEEEPAYTLESLFSDVGGAAGLALGMSLATFFGALEYLMYRLDFTNTIKFYQNNIQNIQLVHFFCPSEIQNYFKNISSERKGKTAHCSSKVGCVFTMVIWSECRLGK